MRQLLDEIDRIGETTNFDEIPLFDGETEVLQPPIPQASQTIKPQLTLQIGHSSPEILEVPRYCMSSKGLILNDINISTLEDANAAIDKIETAIEAVSDIRADFGAAQHHLEHTYQNLSVTSENVTSAESRIRDTDVADEFTTYTKNNIMYQAGNSMCAQANSIPEMVMNLLR